MKTEIDTKLLKRINLYMNAAYWGAFYPLLLDNGRYYRKKQRDMAHQFCKDADAIEALVGPSRHIDLSCRKRRSKE